MIKYKYYLLFVMSLIMIITLSIGFILFNKVNEDGIVYDNGLLSVVDNGQTKLSINNVLEESYFVENDFLYALTRNPEQNRFENLLELYVYNFNTFELEDRFEIDTRIKSSSITSELEFADSKVYIHIIYVDEQLGINRLVTYGQEDDAFIIHKIVDQYKNDLTMNYSNGTGEVNGVEFPATLISDPYLDLKYIVSDDQKYIYSVSTQKDYVYNNVTNESASVTTLDVILVNLGERSVDIITGSDNNFRESIGLFQQTTSFELSTVGNDLLIKLNYSEGVMFEYRYNQSNDIWDKIL